MDEPGYPRQLSLSIDFVTGALSYRWRLAVVILMLSGQSQWSTTMAPEACAKVDQRIRSSRPQETCFSADQSFDPEVIEVAFRGMLWMAIMIMSRLLDVACRVIATEDTGLQVVILLAKHGGFGRARSSCSSKVQAALYEVHTSFQNDLVQPR